MTASGLSAAASESEIERLSLIRYHLQSAGEMLKQPAPINTLAINALQDVVESTLAAVAEHARAEVKPRSDFDKLFDVVVARLGSPSELAGLRAPALALNNARVGFKHHGNQVRDETLRRHHDVTVTLVDELVRFGFGIALDDVSMLVFVPNHEVRAFVERAEAHAAANELTDALSFLRSAFDLATHDFASRKSLDGWHSIFDIGSRSVHHASIDRMGWERPVDELQGWVEALDRRVKLSAMGVDLARYSYFDAVAPKHTNMWHGGRGPIVTIKFDNPSDADYRASYLFVVDTVIRLGASDFNLSSVRERARPAEAFDPTFFSEEYRRRQEENERLRAEWAARDRGADGLA